jgi:hypothetical protein
MENIKNFKKYFPGYENVPLNKTVVIEHILRFGDIDEINQIIEMYGIEECKKCWEAVLLPDIRIKKMNYFYAKFFFYPTEDELFINKLINSKFVSRSNRIENVSNRKNL